MPTKYGVYLILAMCGLLALLVVTTTVLLCMVISDRKKLKSINRNCRTGNLEETIVLYYNKLDRLSAQLDEKKASLDELEKIFKAGIVKTGYMRYDAFDEMQNGLSYSFAILDDKDSGFVLTGIFGRNISNTYLKPIVSGKSTIQLSKEEMQVIEFAKNNYNKKTSLM